MYSETYINWSWSKGKTLLRRRETLDPLCFLDACLSRISKAETVKRALLQTDKLFQSSDIKSTYLTRTQIKQRIKLDIFVNFLKKKHFLYFKTRIIFSGFILQFWRSTILLNQTLYIFFQVALWSKGDIGQGPSNHNPLLYELLEGSNTCRRMN